MNTGNSKPVVIVLLVLVILAAAWYVFLGPGRDAMSGTARAPGEKIELIPTPEHPATPGLGGGGAQGR